MKCWGADDRGQLKLPGEFKKFEKNYNFHLFDEIAVGHFHVCAKRTDQLEIVCWGDNYTHNSDKNQKYNGDILNENHDIPQITTAEHILPSRDNVDDLINDSIYSSVQQIRAGFGFNCGTFTTMSKNIKLVCWGKNTTGQIEVPEFEFDQ